MYQLMCLLSGVLLAFVITTNGTLTAYYGAYVGSVIVHIVGTVGSYIYMKAAKQTGRSAEKLPVWMYAGGIIGIATTVFQSVAFVHLGATAVMALSLFGQTATSLVVDGLGLFGMEKRPVGKGTMLGVLVSLCGIGYMMLGAGDMQAVSLLMAIAAGVSAVFSRLTNAQLSLRTSAAGSTFTNHWVGLVGSILLMFVAEPDIMGCLQGAAAPVWAFGGGIIAVGMITLWNVAGPKVSAFRLTLLSFVGQVFMGILIDVFIGNSFSKQIFIGGGFVVVGVLLNMMMDKEKA